MATRSVDQAAVALTNYTVNNGDLYNVRATNTITTSASVVVNTGAGLGLRTMGTVTIGG